MNDLCLDLGFCLPPHELSKLENSATSDADAFTDAVFVAEGLDPLTADRRLWHAVRDRVAIAFRRQSPDEYP